MNNFKIEKLAKEMDFPMGLENPPWAYEQDIYKFAELIVQDICDWIEGAPSTEEGTIILTKQFIIANLKGRFGVE